MADSKQYITQNQENGTVQISEDVIISIVTVAVGETEGVRASAPGWAPTLRRSWAGRAGARA